MNTYKTAFGKQIPLGQMPLDLLAAFHRVLALAEAHSEDPVEFATRARQTLRREFPKPDQYHVVMRGPVGAVFRDCFYRAYAAKRQEAGHELLRGLGCNPLRLLYDRFLDGDWRYQSDFAADANLDTAAVARAFKTVMENEGRGEVSMKKLEGALTALGVSSELENGGGDEGRGDTFAVMPSSPTSREWVLLLLTSALTRCLSQVHDPEQDRPALEACRDALALNLAFLFGVRDYHELTNFTDLVLREMLGVAVPSGAGRPEGDGTLPVELLAMLVNPDAQSFRLFVHGEAELQHIQQLLDSSREEAAHIPGTRRDEGGAESPIRAGTDWTEAEKAALAGLGNSPWAHSIEGAWSEAVLRVNRWGRTPLASQAFDRLILDLTWQSTVLRGGSAAASARFDRPSLYQPWQRETPHTDPGEVLALKVVSLEKEHRVKKEVTCLEALELALIPEKLLEVTRVEFGIWDCDLLGWAFDRGIARRHGINLKEFVEEDHLPVAVGALIDNPGPQYRAMMLPRQDFAHEDTVSCYDVAIANVFKGYHLFCNKKLLQERLEYQGAEFEEQRLRGNWKKLRLPQDFDEKMPEFLAAYAVKSLQDIVLFMYKHELKVYTYSSTAAIYWNSVLTIVSQQLAALGYPIRARHLCETLKAKPREGTPRKLAQEVCDDPRMLLISTGPGYAAAYHRGLHLCLRPEDVRVAIRDAEGDKKLQSLCLSHRKMLDSTYIHTSINVSAPARPEDSDQNQISAISPRPLERLCAMVMNAARHLSKDTGDLIKYVYERYKNKPSYDFLTEKLVKDAFEASYHYEQPEAYAWNYYSPSGHYPLKSSMDNHFKSQAADDQTYQSSSHEYYRRYLDEQRRFDDMIEQLRLTIESMSRNPDQLDKLPKRSEVIQDLRVVLQIADKLFVNDLHLYGTEMLVKVFSQLRTLGQRPERAGATVKPSVAG